MKNIPFGRPNLDDAEINAVVEVLKGPQLVHGPVAKAFEEKFAERLNVEHAITVSSCTAGLHLGLHVNNIGAGDKVIVPAMTHVATAHSVEYCGAEPIFVDVQPETGNINPDLVEEVIAEAKAMFVVHYLGLPCEMDKLRALADKHNTLLIEDCALAVDASYDGVKAGGLAEMGSFSFYPVKHMTTAEGGMVTTNNSELADKIRNMKAFGYDRGLGERAKPGIYDVMNLGYNYRMSEVHAAIGLAQMDKLDAMQKSRKNNYEALKEGFGEIEEVVVFDNKQGKAQSSHYCMNVVLPKDGQISRDIVVQYLKENGIGSSVHYPAPVPRFKYYANKYGYDATRYEVAEWLADQTISLPVGPHLEADDPAYIVSTFKSAISKALKEAN